MNNVKDFGAKGDGISKDTEAIQQAIDAGGMVLFPPGTYLSGTLYLKSNGGLFLEPGAVLLASPDLTDYNSDDAFSQNNVCSQERVTGAHFILAVEQENIVITGGGRIDGNRQAFYGTPEPPTAEASEEKFSDERFLSGKRPGQMIVFCECNHIQIRDVELFNAPYWTCFIHGCTDVQVRGLHILNDQRTRNGDGIDIDCCQRVTVSDCVIDSGDDCITLRGNDRRLKVKRPCEYITVSNCVLHTNCNAIRIGVGSGTIRNAVFSNIVVHDSVNGICIVSNYSENPAAGALIENIQFENIRLDCQRPFLILSCVCGPAAFPPAKEIRNIFFRSITGTCSAPPLVCGSQGQGVHDISFSSIHFFYRGQARKLSEDMNRRYGEWNESDPACAFYLAHVQKVSFSDTTFRMAETPVPWKCGLAEVNTGNIISRDSFFEQQS